MSMMWRAKPACPQSKVGPGRYQILLATHRMSKDSIIEGAKCVSVMWWAISACVRTVVEGVGHQVVAVRGEASARGRTLVPSLSDCVLIAYQSQGELRREPAVLGGECVQGLN